MPKDKLDGVAPYEADPNPAYSTPLTNDDHIAKLRIFITRQPLEIWNILGTADERKVMNNFCVYFYLFFPVLCVVCV